MSAIVPAGSVRSPADASSVGTAVGLPSVSAPGFTASMALEGS